MCQSSKSHSRKIVLEPINLTKDAHFIRPTREVLMSHLLVQIETVGLDCGLDDLDVISAREVLQKGRADEELVELLKDRSLLKKMLQNLDLSGMQIQQKEKMKTKPEKEEIGEQLFLKVATYDSQLCAQITGMLLELETPTLQWLLNHPKDLSAAVAKAREEYLLFTQAPTTSTSSVLSVENQESSDSSCSDNKETLAERLYETLSCDYPDHAAKITGMLLELDYKNLQDLLSSPDQLQDKVNIALAALKEVEAS